MNKALRVLLEESNPGCTKKTLQKISGKERTY